MSEIDQYSNLLYGLAGVGVAGFVAYVVSQVAKLKDKIHQIEIEMRDKYASIEDTDALERKLDKSLEILYEICGKLGIPIRRD